MGNDGADEAADFGRGRVPWWVIDARRIFSGVCSKVASCCLCLAFFLLLFLRLWLIMIGGAGTSIGPLVWSAGSAPGKRRVAVRDWAFLPGPPDLWVGSWITVAATPISCRDNEVWPHSVGLLVLVGCPFSILCIALLMDAVLVWVECLMWSCSFFMKFGRVRGLNWRRLFLGTAGLVAQFQCRLFLVVQALIFGVPVGLLVHCFGVFGICLLDIGDLFLVMLVLITVGCGKMGGSGVVMVLHPGPVSPRLKTFLTGLFSLVWLSEWVCCCFIG